MPRWFAKPQPRSAPRGSVPGEGPARGGWALAEGDSVAPGRYVLRGLGGGSRHEVYLVWDEALFSLAVAKVLRPGQVADPRALRELRREWDLLARLAHPCLVRGLGATLDGPRPQLLLEHVEGPTLQRAIARDGPLALDQLLPLALHLLAVLHYLAERGVVHLDLKPANVVLSAPPRLIDLSIARPVEDARALRAAIGTDPYMAPEQCLRDDGAPPLSPAADVWALGATLHHAISGAVPYPRAPGASSSNDPSVRFPQLHGSPPPPLPLGTPPLLAAAVASMLAREPGDRPTPKQAAEAIAPLVAAVPDRLVATRRRGLIPPR